jgi:hypothetical protein
MVNKKNLYLFAEITENYGHRLGKYFNNHKSNLEEDQSFFYPSSAICEAHSYRHSFLSKQLISSYFNLNLSSEVNKEESEMVGELLDTYLNSTIEEIKNSPADNALIIIPAFFTIKTIEITNLKKRLAEHFNLFFIFQYSNFLDTIENLFLSHFSGGRLPFFNDFNDFCAWLDSIELFDNIKGSINLFKGGIMPIDDDSILVSGENFLFHLLNLLSCKVNLDDRDLELFKTRKVSPPRVHPLFKSFIKEIENKNLDKEKKIKLNLFLEKFTQKILLLNTNSFSFYEDLSIHHFNKVNDVYKHFNSIGLTFFKKTIPIILKTESAKIFNDYYEM